MKGKWWLAVAAALCVLLGLGVAQAAEEVDTWQKLETAIGAATGTAQEPAVIVIANTGITAANNTIAVGPNQYVKLTGGAITRGQDFEQSFFRVEANAALTLDVTLDGNQVVQIADGPLVQVDGGELILETNAVLYNNKNEKGKYGGGVELLRGAMTMKGGQIKDNSTQYGGGVLINNDSTFTMLDGVIQDNEAPGTGGGGVCIYDGVFDMRGGTITGNTTAGFGAGGGVLLMENGTFKVQGNVKIDQNSTVVGNKTQNVYLLQGTAIQVTGDLTGSIGVSPQTISAVIAQGNGHTLKQAEARVFFSDDQNYAPVLNNNEVTLTKAVAQVGDQLFNRLNDAIDAALTKNASVILLRSCSLDTAVTLASGKSLTLEGQGTVTVNQFTVGDGASFTLSDRVTLTGTVNEYAVTVEGGGAFTMKGNAAIKNGVKGVSLKKDGTMKVQEDAVVSGNADGATKQNIVMAKGAFITGAGKLFDDARLGVTKAEAVTGSLIAKTDGYTLTEEDALRFTSDDPIYQTVLDNNQIILNTKAFVAQIGDQKYYTLAEAIDAAKGNQKDKDDAPTVITLLADCGLPQPVALAGGDHIKLIGEHKVVGSRFTVQRNASLTLGGKVTLKGGSSGYAVTVEDGGMLRMSADTASIAGGTFGGVYLSSMGSRLILGRDARITDNTIPGGLLPPIPRDVYLAPNAYITVEAPLEDQAQIGVYPGENILVARGTDTTYTISDNDVPYFTPQDPENTNIRFSKNGNAIQVEGKNAVAKIGSKFYYNLHSALVDAQATKDNIIYPTKIELLKDCDFSETTTLESGQNVQLMGSQTQTRQLSRASFVVENGASLTFKSVSYTHLTLPTNSRV